MMQRHVLQRAFGLAILSSLVLASVSKSQTKPAEIDSILAGYHESGLFNGAVLVADAREVIYKSGFGHANMEWDVPNAPDTRFLIASITKQFTAALVLRLAERGLIDLQAPITDYLPEYPSASGGRVEGFRTMLYRVPSRGQTVIIWDNTDGRWAGDLALYLVGVLNGQAAPSPEELLESLDEP